MRLMRGEPEAGPWQPMALTELIDSLIRPIVEDADRTVVIAIDGRGSSGKTTLAQRLHLCVAGAVVIHTDDIAWAHSRFGWADLLVDGVLGPLRAGETVHYRPPAWDVHQRDGFLDVPAGTSVLFVEGVGAGRRELTSLIDRMIWVQTDADEVERRGLARIGTPGSSPTMQLHLDWMVEEIPFVADQRPWERADIVVCGSSQDRSEWNLMVASRQL